MDPVAKFSTLHKQMPRPLVWFLKPDADKPGGEAGENKDTPVKEEFKEWPKLFQTTIVARHTENAEDVNDNDAEFLCVKCNKTFSSQQALGGHSSKSHPGSSSKYNQKLTVR